MSSPGGFHRNLAVVVGIDRYLAPIPPLRSAVNDARRLGELLASGHGFSVLSLFDDDASRPALDDLLTRRLPAEVGPDDRVIFYFAGHGVAVAGDDGPNGCILPQDARPGEPATYLEMTRLHDALETLPCRHMLVVLDSCFAGAFRWSTMRDLMYAPGVVHREQYDRFVRDPAWQVITSAADDQTAADQLLSGTLGGRGDAAHSPFALALFEALAGAADLAPAGGDGLITATELYLYLEQRLQVETLTQHRRQTPGLWPLRKHDKGEFVFLVPGRAQNLPPAPPLTYETNPYRGLASYGRQDAEIFFGRGAVVDELSARAAAQPLTVVLGASGTGKSSVVNAGVGPRLEEKSGWTVLPAVRPGSSPFQALARAVSSPGFDVAATAAGILDGLQRRLDGPGPPLLLVIDQFEELITLTRAPAVRGAYLDLLADLLALGHARLRIVVTIRSDFEAQFDESRLRGAWQAGRYVVPPWSRQDFRAVIEGPAAHRVVYFEPSSLVETLLDDVSAMPGGLPLLSFTLSELYRRYVQRNAGNRALTREDYDSLGGVAGALRARADAEVAALDSAHQATLRRLLLRMVAADHGTLARQRVKRVELVHWDPAESARIAAVLARLTEARLVVEGVGADGAAYVEPAHDALVTSWSRLLEWTHQAQDREPDLHFLHTLARSAHDWNDAEARVRPGLLWRDKVRSARLWALRTGDRVQLNQTEDRFCRASVARRRFVRNGIAALVTAIAASGLLAIGLGVVAERQRAEAVAQRDVAQRQTRAASSSALTAKAANALDDQQDATAGFKLAAAALEADPANVAAAMLLRRAMYGSGVMEYRGRWYGAPAATDLPMGAGWAAWSPDGAQVVLGNAGTDASGQQVEVFSPDGAGRGRFVVDGLVELRGFSSDGQFILGSKRDRPLAWDLDGRQLSAAFAETLRPGPGPGHEVAWEASTGSTATYLTSVTPDGLVRAGQALERWVSERGAWEYSPDRTFDFVRPRPGMTDRTAWGPFAVMKRGAVVAEVPGDWVRTALTWDGRYVATGGLDGTVALWRVDGDSRGATRLGVLWRAAERIEALAFSPDGSNLLAADGRGTTKVWHLTAYPLTTGPDEASPSPATVPAGVSATVTTLGDNEATLVVKDEQSGVTWTRSFNSNETSAAVLGDGVVAVSDTQTLWVIDRAGIEQARLPIGAALVTTTPDRRVLHLRQYLESSEQVLVLPVAAADLVAAARATGNLALSSAERERWGVGGMLAGLEAMAAERPPDETGLDLFIAAVTGAFSSGAVTPGAVPPPAALLVPDAWRALEGSPAFATEARVRALMSDLRDSGAMAAVLTMGGPAPFMAGPHQGGVWDLGSETFGEYNPAFVTWLSATLVPGSRDHALRRATQVAYDRRLRRAARVHALALSALDRQPELKASVVAAYASRREARGEYLRTALLPLAGALGPRPEGEPEDVADAAGFWIRRHLDGTAPEFRAALRRLLSAYDPGALSLLESRDGPPPAEAAIASRLAAIFWNGLGAPPCTAPQDVGMGFGSRVVYCAAARSGALHVIAASAGIPVFDSGPHHGAELDLHADTFGHYNPAFVRWARDTLLPAEGDQALVAATAPIYDRLVRKAGRAYLLALQAVEANPAVITRLTAAIRSGSAPKAALELATAELMAHPTPEEVQGDDEWLWHHVTASRFWLRRSLDGTRPEFAGALRRMLAVYDAPALAAAPARRP